MSKSILRICTIFVALMHDDYSLSRNLIYCLCYWYKQQTCQQGQMTKKQAAGDIPAVHASWATFPQSHCLSSVPDGGAQRVQHCPCLPAKLTSGRGQSCSWAPAVTFILYPLTLTLCQLAAQVYCEMGECTREPVQSLFQLARMDLLTSWWHHSFGILVLRSIIVAENRGLITCTTVYSLGNVSLSLPPSLSHSPVYSL